MVTPLSFYDENIPCLAACPVHTNAVMYVAAIADADDEQAYLTARLPNPFASVCGRVCAAPCEDACRRGQIDRPIAIRALKRYVTEKFGSESVDLKDREATSARPWDKVAAPPQADRPQSVGIVGGGPAGMAAAHDLRRFGYSVVVYEATDKLGGAMWLGIPEYRLDRDVLNADIDAILELGVEVRTNTKLGQDITLDDLRREHDAVFLGIGATLGRGLDIEGADADGVFKAIEFLINMNRGFDVEIGERVLVIGGGDVAMDAARTALRAADYEQHAQQAFSDDHDRPSMTDAIDVARTAARAGARHITVMSLESREEMPAHEFEIEEAEHEGVEFVSRRGPQRLLVADGAVTGVETIGVRSVFDDQGRFAPDFDDTDIAVLEADTVILAIGQAIDIESLGAKGPTISERRTIQIDNDTGATSLPDVWAGGDAAKGPRTLIDAVADVCCGNPPGIRSRGRASRGWRDGGAAPVPSLGRSLRPSSARDRTHVGHRAQGRPCRSRTGLHRRAGPMRSQPLPPLFREHHARHHQMRVVRSVRRRVPCRRDFTGSQRRGGGRASRHSTPP